jgi:hypothetical protein
MWPGGYERGKDRIDYIFISSDLLHGALRSGILPYNSVFMSDHRATFLDLDSIVVLREITSKIEPPAYHGLQLHDPRITTKYNEALIAQIKQHKLLEKAT